MGIFDRLRRGNQDSSAPTLDDLPKTEVMRRPGAARPAPDDSPKTEVVRRPGAPRPEPPRSGPKPRPATAAGDAEATLYEGAPARVVAVLVGIEGSLANQVFAVVDGSNRLGRGESCQVVLPSPRISREHARLDHRDGHFEIAPLSDKNPTRVNGEATQGTDLKDGDDVKLGDTTFRFRSVG